MWRHHSVLCLRGLHTANTSFFSSFRSLWLVPPMTSGKENWETKMWDRLKHAKLGYRGMTDPVTKWVFVSSVTIANSSINHANIWSNAWLPGGGEHTPIHSQKRDLLVHNASALSVSWTVSGTSRMLNRCSVKPRAERTTRATRFSVTNDSSLLSCCYQLRLLCRPDVTRFVLVL